MAASCVRQGHEARASFRTLVSYTSSDDTASTDTRIQTLVGAGITSHQRHNLADARINRLGEHTVQMRKEFDDLSERVATLEIDQTFGSVE